MTEQRSPAGAGPEPREFDPPRTPEEDAQAQAAADRFVAALMRRLLAAERRGVEHARVLVRSRANNRALEVRLYG